MLYVVIKLVCLFMGHQHHPRQFPWRGQTISVCRRCGDLELGPPPVERRPVQPTFKVKSTADYDAEEWDVLRGRN